MILKSNDFYKNGELKPNKDPSNPTKKNIPKAEWVLITRGRQRLPSKNAWTSNNRMEKKRGIETNNKKKWTDRWVEFDAVASEYMTAEVLNIFKSRRASLALLVKGESEEFAELLGKTVDAKVSARGFAHTRRKDINRKHIQSLADRITDRLIETIEENPYEEWFESIGKQSNRNISPRFFDAWVESSESASTLAPTYTVNYWKWIFAKASGENV